MNVWKIQRSLFRRSRVVSVRGTIRERVQVSRIVHVEDMLEQSQDAIRNRLATKSDGRDEQRSVEQASEDLGIWLIT